MGKASSSKKVQRASRAAGRPGAKKSYAWPASIGLVVLVGVAVIVLSRNGGTVDKSAPIVGDHWHAAYGIYDCDHYESPLKDAASDTSGIHTHGEGLMHMHPFSSHFAGKGANVGALMLDTGSKLSDTKITANGTTLKNGGKCGSKVATLELLHWDSPGDATPTVLTTGLAKYAPKNGSVWALAFVPSGTKVPQPPAAANLADPLAVEEGRQPATGAGTASTTPGTSVPVSPTTTIPPGDSSTTAKP